MVRSSFSATVVSWLTWASSCSQSCHSLSLSDRERHILTERRLQENPTTLEELASQYGVSRERVRQIEVRAFEKLQKAMRAAATERNLMAV